MQYNTATTKLIIPEYGRNVQNMINYAKTIEDEEYRQAFVERIVQLMYQMHPQARNIEDYKTKLWAHVFQIANYELDVIPPGPIPTAKDPQKRPKPIPYPSINIRLRHYGKNVHSMIKKASEIEDPEKKKAFALIIGSYMKMAYKTWNLEMVSNETIKTDLLSISKGALELPDNANLDGLIGPNDNSHKQYKKHHKGKSSYKKNHNNGKKNYKKRK